MEAAGAQDWLLRKHEAGNIFGPLPFAQLPHWACSVRLGEITDAIARSN
jgi:hypothetical protein